MTFNSVTHHTLPSDDLAIERIRHENNRHGGTCSSGAADNATRERMVSDDRNYDTQISNWEDEGGADPHVSRHIHCRDSISEPQRFSDHIDAARIHMDTGNYEAAYEALEAATQRFVSYREKLSGSVDASIAHLSTLGCRATPPHPVALPLVKLRRHLAG